MTAEEAKKASRAYHDENVDLRKIVASIYKEIDNISKIGGFAFQIPVTLTGPGQLDYITTIFESEGFEITVREIPSEFHYIILVSWLN